MRTRTARMCPSGGLFALARFATLWLERRRICGGGQAGRGGDGEGAVGCQVVGPAGGLVLAAVVAGAEAGEVVRGRGPVGPGHGVVELASGGHPPPAAGEPAAAVAGPRVTVESGPGTVGRALAGWAEAGPVGQVVGADG